MATKNIQTLAGVISGVYKVVVGAGDFQLVYVFDFNTRTVWQEQTESFPYEFVHNFFDIDTAEVGQKLVFTAAIVGLGYSAVYVSSTVISIASIEPAVPANLNNLPVKVNGLWFQKLPSGDWQVMGTKAKVSEEELFGEKTVEVSEVETWELQLFNVNRTEE